jgi:glycosyltransferase involved in cell wall biosynthesis
VIDARSITPRLIWVGRMQAQKNLLFGLRALALLPDVPWHLDLVGDGPQREAAEALTRELGLSNRVRFHGWLAHDAVQKIMAESNILFLPSLGEGFPVVAVEALSHGLALLCSRIGGLADVARDHLNARTCPVGDAAAYAEALRDLCTNPDELKAMQHASRHIAHEFDLPDIVDAYETTLHQAALTRVQPAPSIG